MQLIKRLSPDKASTGGRSRARHHPLTALLPRQCLGIDYADEEIRAALVEMRGSSMQIIDYLALKADDVADELPSIGQLREIHQRLNCKPNMPSVFVTPMARVVSVQMNWQRVRKMRRDILIDAAKWEAETYTGIAAQQAFAGLEVDPPRPQVGQIQREVEEVDVSIAVLEKNVYRAIRERWRMAGLKLVRVFAPEVCFPMALREIHPDTDRAVLDIGNMASGFALLSGGKVLAINTLNITRTLLREHLAGDVVPDLDSTLSFNLNQAPGPLPVVITGIGAMDAEIVGFIHRLAPFGAQPIKLSRRAALVGAGQDETGPLFASAAGAAMRELGERSLQRIGISDAVPWARRIRENASVVPLATASGLFLLMLAHSGLMQFQEERLRERRIAIDAQVAERRAEAQAVEGLRKKIQDVEKDISTLQDQLTYIRADWDRPLRIQIALHRTLAEVVTPSIGLRKIHFAPRNAAEVIVEGNATSPADVMELLLLLDASGMAQNLAVDRMDRVSGSVGTVEIYTFTIRFKVRLDGQKTH